MAEQVQPQQGQPQPQQAFPMVPPGEAKKFGAVWHHNGVNIILNDSHHKFAEDFANVVLRNFVLQCQAQAAAALKAVKEQEAKSKIVL